MNSARPRENICTQLTQSTTRFLHTYLNALSSTLYGSKKPYDNLPHADGLTIADILFSDAGVDSRKFATILKSMVDTAEKHSSKQCSVYFGPNRGVLVVDPDQLREILVEHKDDLHPKETFPLFEHSFPNSVMPKEYGTADWRNSRNEIASNVSALTKNPEMLIKTAVQYVNNFMASKSEKFNLKEFAESFTVEVIAKGFIGTHKVSDAFKKQMPSLISEGVDTAVQLRNVIKLTLSKHMPVTSDPFLHSAEKIMKDEILEKHNFKSIFGDEKQPTDNWTTRKYAAEKQVAIDKNQHAWICKNNTYTIDNLVNDLCFLMTAGSDTTSRLIMFAFLHVSQNSRVFSKMIDEVKRLGKKPEEWTANDLQQMRYMDAITLETLRLNPPLKYRRRKIEHPFTMKNGTQFKAGDHIFLHVGATQRSEKIYDNPLEFRPERFENENINQYLTQTLPSNHRHHLAWHPFGLGPRMCPGAPLAVLELKVLLATFAYYYDMILENKWHPNQTIETFGSRPDDTKEALWVGMKLR